jgi:hypothetical protein
MDRGGPHVLPENAMSVSIVKPLETSMEDKTGASRLPRVKDQPLPDPMSAAGPPESSMMEPNPLFGLLVQGEHDIPGLLAYSLYKQNKRDWLIAFEAAQGRAPTTAETDAFILGERLPRRTQTYRRLAEDMLGKDGLRQPVRADNDVVRAALPNRDATMQVASALQSKGAWKTVLFLLALVVAMAVVFRSAAGYLFG